MMMDCSEISGMFFTFFMVLSSCAVECISASFALYVPYCCFAPQVERAAMEAEGSYGG